ncbi:hypothetical protein [Adhaeribacter radiodurans]|uniref:Uncharacterized protein n=1 Tax=Adhaeribacter radiodurans TaxID=2745197 RepID=A0A7L7LDD9_9BACT|nr:hypothetical protein [Adhaeribacter radiodurans]QMU30866.1 hypothetical protein HUW48_23800 [Adhaeribacter radiodurans]
MAGGPRRGTRAGYFSFSPDVEMPKGTGKLAGLRCPDCCLFLLANAFLAFPFKFST